MKDSFEAQFILLYFSGSHIYKAEKLLLVIGKWNSIAFKCCLIKRTTTITVIEVCITCYAYWVQ